MLKGERQNIHQSKLPKLGTVGHIVGLSTVGRQSKCIVVAYPLTDSVEYHFSMGIHTVFVRFLHNGEIRQLSGIWFEPVDDSVSLEHGTVR